ncbi:MAG: TolC family protein [Bacteroidaceae bacterium]|nr:TolC family protein [Bacteroidaceae bacterium]
MKHFRIIIALVAISTALTVNSQDDNFQFSTFNFQFSEVLDSIEKNNTTLIALRTDAEARKLENRTGITLADPEVGYKHVWEGADETGKLTEFTVSQRIDLATVTGQRKRVARRQNRVIDEEYRMARMEILLDAQLTLVDLAYYNALAAELDRRLGHARRVVEAERVRFDNGDTDALSYNNVLLSLSALEAEEARIEMERSVLIARLTALNGGVSLDNLESLDAIENLKSLDNLDFSSWYAEAEAHLPQLAGARQLCEARSSELALAKSMYLPSLSATYINERHTIGSRSQGVAIGMSIPLWANKNSVRTARTALEAAEANQADVALRLRSAYEQEFTRVKGLQQTAMRYRRALDEANNSALLQRAMDEGLISVLEYLQGIELYYDYLDRSLGAERDYLRARAELEAWRL